MLFTLIYCFAGAGVVFAGAAGATGAAFVGAGFVLVGLAALSAGFVSSLLGTISEEGIGVSKITSSFFANKKESRSDKTIKDIAITLVAFVRTSALEEPNAV